MNLNGNKNDLLEKCFENNKLFFKIINRHLSKKTVNTIKIKEELLNNFLENDFELEYNNKELRVELKKPKDLSKEYIIISFLLKDKEIFDVKFVNNNLTLTKNKIIFKYDYDYTLDRVENIKCILDLDDNFITIKPMYGNKKYLNNICTELDSIAKYDFEIFLNYLKGKENSLNKILEINDLYKLQFDLSDKIEYYLKHENYFYNIINKQNLKIVNELEKKTFKDKCRNFLLYK